MNKEVPPMPEPIHDPQVVIEIGNDDTAMLPALIVVLPFLILLILELIVRYQ